MDEGPGSKRPLRDNKWVGKAAQASIIGWMLVVCPIVGYVIGAWIDSKLHSSPWATLVFLVLGIAAGFYEVVKLVIRLSR